MFGGDQTECTDRSAPGGANGQLTRRDEPSPRSPSTISLPKGDGALRSIDEKFTINPANGSCSLSIALAFSKARSDVGLNLALEYNSSSGNSALALEYNSSSGNSARWSISPPTIRCRAEKQRPLYRDAVESDVFAYSGSEDLVPGFVQDGAGDWTPDIAGSGSLHVRRYGPRIDSQFARIEKIAIDGEAAFYWKVTTRDNVVTIFGRTAAARLDPNDPARIFRWLPEWTYDDPGNCAEFAYKNEDLTNVPASTEETVEVLNVSYDPGDFAITGNAGYDLAGVFRIHRRAARQATLWYSQKSTLSDAFASREESASKGMSESPRMPLQAGAASPPPAACCSSGIPSSGKARTSGPPTRADDVVELLRTGAARRLLRNDGGCDVFRVTYREACDIHQRFEHSRRQILGRRCPC
jgi:Salmonella virulence plasmid 65kDa B protein